MRRALTIALVTAMAASAPCAARAAGSDPEPVAKPRGGGDYDIGKAAIAKGDFAAAITALKRAVASEPRNANAFNLLGFATRKSGDPRGSLQYYQQALAIDPTHIGAHEYIGEA